MHMAKSGKKSSGTKSANSSGGKIKSKKRCLPAETQNEDSRRQSESESGDKIRADVESEQKRIRIDDDDVQQSTLSARGNEDLPETLSSFREKTDQLTSAFGSSKKQRAMRSRHLNKIGGEALDAAMEATLAASVISHAKASKADQVQAGRADAQSVELLPPHNKEASYPQDVYQIGDIISQVEFEAMKTHSADLVKATDEDVAQWREENKFGYFVTNHIPMLPVNPEKRIEAAAKLLYLNVMIKMYQVNVSQLRKLPALNGVPQCVKGKLINEFTVSSPSTTSNRPLLLRPNRLKDKLLLRILILAMMVDGFRLQLSELMMDLTLNKKSLTNYLRAIGAHVKRSTETILGQRMENLVATIAIPLTFPQVKGTMTRRH